MQGAKSANSELFKDFCNEAEMEKNKASCVIYLVIVPNAKIKFNATKQHYKAFCLNNI